MNEINKTPEYTVQPGDSIWKIIENQLEAHDLFKGLEEGQRIHLIDELKDKVEGMTEAELKEFGIGSGNAQLIHPGEELNFSKIITPDSVEEAAVNAENLTEAQIKSIESYEPPVEQTPTDGGVGAETGAEGAASEAAPQSPDPMGDTITGVESGSEQAQMLHEQHGDFAGNEQNDMLVEQEAPFMAERILEKDIHEMYGSDGVFGIMGTKGVDTVAWKDLQGHTVTELMEKQEFASTDDHGISNDFNRGFENQQDVGKLQSYLENVKEHTKVEPLKNETVNDYLKRAIEVDVTPKE